MYGQPIFQKPCQERLQENALRKTWYRKTVKPDSERNGLRPNRHRVVKYIVGIVTPFDALKEGIKSILAIKKLWPVRICQHIGVRIIDIAALEVFPPPWSAFVLFVDLGA